MRPRRLIRDELQEDAAGKIVHVGRSASRLSETMMLNAGVLPTVGVIPDMAN